MRTRAIMQALVNKDEAEKALTDYRDTQMPYLPRIKRTERDQHIKRLMDEVAKGAMSITPVMQRQVRSKLKTRVVQRQTEEQVESMRRISKKIGGFT